MHTSEEVPDAETVVGQYWPLHGPYSHECTEAAAATVAELVRYLNYATGQGARAALPYAATVNDTVNGLAGAISRLDQTLQQLADRTHELAADPALYHNKDRADHELAMITARQGAEHLDAARRAADALHEALSATRSSLAHLGHRTDEDD